MIYFNELSPVKNDTFMKCCIPGSVLDSMQLNWQGNRSGYGEFIFSAGQELKTEIKMNVYFLVCWSFP